MWLEGTTQNPGSIPGGGPKRFHDSFNFVFHIVGECISCAADTHFGHGFDLLVLFFPPRTAPDLPVTAGVGLGFWVVPSSHMLKTEFLCHFCGKGFSGVLSEI